MVLVCGLADAVLLAVLLFLAFTGHHGPLVAVIGAIHGLNFLLLLALTGYGARRGHWRWWFPLAVLVTAGPPGSILGDIHLRRQAASKPTHSPDDAFEVER